MEDYCLWGQDNDKWRFSMRRYLYKLNKDAFTLINSGISPKKFGVKRDINNSSPGVGKVSLPTGRLKGISIGVQ